jgi:hypothetical protein
MRSSRPSHHHHSPQSSHAASITVVADVFADWSTHVLPPTASELYVGHRGYVSSIIMTNIEGELQAVAARRAAHVNCRFITSSQTVTGA